MLLILIREGMFMSLIFYGDIKIDDKLHQMYDCTFLTYNFRIITFIILNNTNYFSCAFEYQHHFVMKKGGGGETYPLGSVAPKFYFFL